MKQRASGRRRRYPLPAIALAALVFQGTAQAAEELRAGYGVYLSSGQSAYDDEVSTFCLTAGCAVLGGLGGASVLFDQWGHYARAAAMPGILRARAYAEWPDFIYTPRYAWAEAGLTDTLTLTHPDIEPYLKNVGTWLQVKFSVDGDLDYTGSGQAEFTLHFNAQATESAWFFDMARFKTSLDAGGLTFMGYGGFADHAWPAGTTGSPFGVFETYAWMPYNQPIRMTWSLVAGASLLPDAYGTAGSAHARLDHTATLIGMQVVEPDGFGVMRPVEGAAILAASGYDYAMPIPLPAPVWLMLSGLAALTWRFRRHDRLRLTGL